MTAPAGGSAPGGTSGGGSASGRAPEASEAPGAGEAPAGGGPPSGAAAVPTLSQLAVYLLLGVGFGIVLVKSEVVSWFRIQEMFRFQAFHMYGVIGSALAVAMPLVAVLKRGERRSATGEPIVVPPKALGSGARYAIGGALFGVGWALVGACPGPMFALIGAGSGVMALALLSALVGAWTYGALRPRLPH